jgi:hypothetical protein
MKITAKHAEFNPALRAGGPAYSVLCEGWGCSAVTAKK